ncbi:hypothetical protein TNCV_4431441 [Trichonephila clavipes]|nr:hypothetical protein TNCV_4431441 [Trichonephila clavipes]
MGTNKNHTESLVWRIEDMEADTNAIFLRFVKSEGSPMCTLTLMDYLPSKRRFDLSTLSSENEYINQSAKTIVVAKRLLLVYIDITPPHYPPATDSARRRTNDPMVHGECVSSYVTLSATGLWIAPFMRDDIVGCVTLCDGLIASCV